MTREEDLKIVKQFDGKYPHYGIKSFIEYSGMSKSETHKASHLVVRLPIQFYLKKIKMEILKETIILI